MSRRNSLGKKIIIILILTRGNTENRMCNVTLAFGIFILSVTTSEDQNDNYFCA